MPSALDLAPPDAREALALMHGVGGDDLVITLLRTFVRFADERVAAATEAATAGDGAAVNRIAHALKSSASQVGAHAVGKACAEAEAETPQADAERTTALVAAISREYATARVWMETVMTPR